MTDRDFEKKVAEAKIERKVSRAMGKMIAQNLLEAETPEEIKMVVRVVEAAKDVEDVLHESLDASMLVSDNVDIDNLKKWCFFLTTITAQIKAFAENAPLTTGGEQSDDK